MASKEIRKRKKWRPLENEMANGKFKLNTEIFQDYQKHS